MGDKANIEWTEATWNPIRGCTRVSEGCRNCYAEEMAARFCGPGLPYEGLARRTKSGQPRWTGKVAFLPEKLGQPLHWRKPRLIFVNSMSDLFHESLTNEQIAAVFGVMAATPRHTYQILTKRPERMLEWFGWLEREGRNLHFAQYLDSGEEEKAMVVKLCGSAETGRLLPCARQWPLPNVWLGVSVEDQPTADERIPILLQCPAAVRWVSAEPLLGPVDLRFLQPGEPPTEINALAGTHGVLRPHGGECDGLDWVVVGGESGRRARPMHPEWARSLRDQCVALGVPFTFKQWGSWAPWDDDNWSLPAGEDDILAREKVLKKGGVDFLYAGKKAAGRLLDGREWNEMPERHQ